MLTIVSAMEEELAPVRAALEKYFRAHPGPVSPSLTFSVIGIGRDGLESNVKGLLRVLRQLPAADSPSELLLLGFAGGVDPSLSAGDLVLARRYCHLRDLGELLVRVPDGLTLEEHRRREMAELMARDPNLPRRAVLKFLEPDPGMWQRARDALTQEGLMAVVTDSMTVGQLVTSPDTKRELHRRYQVGTVNMEDYWVARLAAAAKVPFLSVRAVVDTAGQGVPPNLVGLLEPSRPAPTGSGWAALPPHLVGLSGHRWGRAVGQILARPWQAPGLLRLAGQMRLAQASLAEFALAFVSYRQGAASLPPAAAT